MNKRLLVKCEYFVDHQTFLQLQQCDMLEIQTTSRLPKQGFEQKA